MKKILATIAITLMLAACVDTTTGVKMDTNKLDQLQAGTTTIEQAEALLGQPTGDLRTNFVANQAVSSAGMISGWDQFRRMVAGGL